MPILVKIQVDDKGNAKVVELEKNIKKLQSSVEPLGPVLEKVFAGAGVIYGLDKLKDGIVSVSSEIGKFDQNMRRIEGIGGVAGKALGQVGATARKIATDTEFSASRISNAMLEMVKQGFDQPMELAQTMPTIADLATSAMMELNYSAENTINIMREFNMRNDEASRVANVMATVLNKTGANAEDFMEAMKYAGSVGHTTGKQFEEVAATLGVLADAGIKGSMSGTTLRSVFIRFLEPSEGMRKGLASIGAEGKTLGEIFALLRKNGLSIIDFLDTFDRTAISGTMALTNPNTAEKLRKLNADLYSNLQTVGQISGVVREGLIPSLQNLGNNLNEVALSIFDAFGDRPKSAISGVTDKIKDLDHWVDTHQEQIAKLGRVFTDLTSVLTTVGGTALTAVISNFNTLSIATLALVGTNQLGKMPKLMDDVAKNFNEKSLSMATNWTTFTNGILVAITTFTTLKILMDSAFDSWNTKMDQQTKDTGDRSESMLNRKISILDKLKDAYIEMQRNEEAASQMPYSQSKNAIANGPDTNEGVFAFYKNKVDALKKEYKSLSGMEISSYIEAGQAASQLDKIKQSLYGPKTSTTPAPSKTDPMGILPAKVTEGAKSKAEKAGIFKWLKEYESGSDKNDDGFKDFEKTSDNALDQAFEDSKKRKQAQIDFEVDKREESMQKTIELYTKTRKKIDDSAWSLGQSTEQIIETIMERKLEKTIEYLEKEKQAVEDRYDAEIKAAGSNAFKKDMLEQRKAQAVIEADRKVAKVKEELNRKQKMADNAKATADMLKGIIGAMAETGGPAYVRIASGLSMAAIMGAYVAQLVAINYRDGGIVDGPGNNTSDSILARLSKGERVLSTREIDAMGGNERIQQTIDRGATYNKNSSVNITFGTIIGTKQYVRETLLPEIKKELQR